MVPSTAALSQDNRVTIELHGTGNDRSQPAEFFADSVPSDPSYGNAVTVIR